MQDHLATARHIIRSLGLSDLSASAPCPGCGALVPDVPDGPIHPDLGASPGCWALYTAMLGREFIAFDAEVHRLSVDTYAVQHPGTPSPQAIQSVCAHLVALCLTFEHGWRTDRLRAVTGDLGKGRFFESMWLTPPAPPYPMTIADLPDAATPDAYGAQVRRWAETTWAAWGEHHPQVRAWAMRVSGQAEPSGR